MEHSECEGKYQGEHICFDMGTKIFDSSIWGSNSLIFVTSHSEKSNWRNMYLMVERLCLGRGLQGRGHVLIHLSMSEL